MFGCLRRPSSNVRSRHQGRLSWQGCLIRHNTGILFSRPSVTSSPFSFLEHGETKTPLNSPERLQFHETLSQSFSLAAFATVAPLAQICISGQRVMGVHGPMVNTVPSSLCSALFWLRRMTLFFFFFLPSRPVILNFQQQPLLSPLCGDIDNIVASPPGDQPDAHRATRQAIGPAS